MDGPRAEPINTPVSRQHEFMLCKSNASKTVTAGHDRYCRVRVSSHNIPSATRNTTFFTIYCPTRVNP